MKITSDSPLKTKKLGNFLAKEILKTGNKDPIILGLKGNLGSGKTTFIQGLAKGLGVKNRITSPTFVIFRHYGIKNKNHSHLFHMDAYRIKKMFELNPINFKEIVSFPRSVVVIEWPEKIKKALPRNAKWLNFKHGKKENERLIEFKT
jgi:tRNA threonylcarbamoyladenosine biosynthesis protein TsaE